MMMAFWQYLFIIGVSVVSLLTADPQFERGDISKIMNEIFAQHLDKRQVSVETLKSALLSYLDQFDPDRLYLLEEEVASYERLSEAELYQILGQYRAGEFTAFEALNSTIQGSILRARQLRAELNNEKQKLAREAIALAPLEDERWKELSLQSSFAKTASELTERNRREIVQQLASLHSRFGSEQLIEHLSRVLLIYEQGVREKENKYLFRSSDGTPLTRVEREHLFSILVLKALTKSLDAHTSFYSPQEAVAVRARLEKEFQGVGIILEQRPDGAVIVSELLKGSPAALSKKIETGDQIIKINGRSVVDESLSSLLDMLQNSAEREIELKLLRTESRNPLSTKEISLTLRKAAFTLYNDRIESRHERYRNGIIGIITLHSFYQGDDFSSETDIKDAIAELKNKGTLVGVILDIRENSGGFLNQAIKVTGLFISNGVVAISKYFNGEQNVYRDLDSERIYSGPMVVLTSRATASAAEIVAQTLQDYGIALVVGDETTYGKGTIQNQTVTSQRNSYFKVTVGKYYTVSGKTPQLEGVKADIVVPGPYNRANIGERYLTSTVPADTIRASYNDDLGDIPTGMREWFQRNYYPTLQQKKNIWRNSLGTLKNNSAIRMSLQPKTSYDKSEQQLSEALNIVKEMIDLNQIAH